MECQYHGFSHKREHRELVIRNRGDHKHVLDTWFTGDDTAIVECVLCGDQWGTA
jgi:hypothetical protein